MKRKRKDDAIYRILKGVIKLLLVGFILLIPFGVFFLTCRIENITVEGNSRYTEDELIDKVINSSTDGNTLLLYARYKYNKVVNIPFVEDIDIEIINKNHIKIHVYEKIITGCIEFMGGYLYFDRDGIIVESSNVKLDKVPYITGLQFSKMVLHEQLEIQNHDLFLVILNLTQLIYKYELDVDTIRFDNNDDITLNCGNIKVLLGRRDTYDEQITELKNLLEKADNQKLIIDLTKFKEGQNKIIAKPVK